MCWRNFISPMIVFTLSADCCLAVGRNPRNPATHWSRCSVSSPRQHNQLWFSPAAGRQYSVAVNKHLSIVLPPRWTGLSVFCQTAHTQSLSEQQSENYFSAPHHLLKQSWPVSQKEKIFCFPFCFTRRPNFFSECFFVGAQSQHISIFPIPAPTDIPTSHSAAPGMINLFIFPAETVDQRRSGAERAARGGGEFRIINTAAPLLHSFPRPPALQCNEVQAADIRQD